MSETVEWRDVPGWEGCYKVSNDGQIYSIARSGCKGGLRKFHINAGGYRMVSLKSHGRSLTTGIHRLVALAFVPNPENKPQVNHINGKKDDNRAENLEWVTAKENTQHAFLKGLNDERLRKDRRPVFAIDKQSGEVYRFDSITSAAKSLEMDLGYVAYVARANAKHGKGVRYWIVYQEE